MAIGATARWRAASPTGGGAPGGLPRLPGGSGFGASGSVPMQNIGPGFSAPGSPPATGGGFGATAPGLPPPPLNNTVTPSADLTWLQDQYKGRLTADPTARATAKATSAIRDNTTGLMKEMGANFAARGMGQAGARKNAGIDLATDAQRRIADAASNIALGRERDLDSLVMGGLPIMGAQEELGLRKQGIGLQQWTAEEQARQARERLGLEAKSQAENGQLQLMNLWSQWLNAFR